MKRQVIDGRSVEVQVNPSNEEFALPTASKVHSIHCFIFSSSSVDTKIQRTTIHLPNSLVHQF